MKNIYIKYVFLLVSITTLFYTCKKDEIIEPLMEQESKLSKSLWKYKWKKDTIIYPLSYQTVMTDIWGSSSKNVYIVGHNDRGGWGEMFRFDGEKWSEIKVGGIVPASISLSRIWGFDSTNIYVGGDYDEVISYFPKKWISRSLILHFDGKKWHQEELENGGSISKIWGNSPNNIYATGVGNQYWHYDGVKWKKEYLPIKLASDMFFNFHSLTGTKAGELYGLAFSHQQDAFYKDVYYFLNYKNNEWKIIDTAIVDSVKFEIKWGTSRIWLCPNGKLYSFSDHMYEWTGKEWISLYYVPHAAFYGINCTDETNIFLVGMNGLVMQYDGYRFYEFKEFRDENVHYSSVWLDENEVFIVGNDGLKTYILHGK